MDYQHCFRPIYSGLSLVGALSLGLYLTGCNPQAAQDLSANLPQVVATSTILADLAQSVGGEEIQLTGLLQPGDDPHIYEPVPQDTVALEQADLIFYNGFNLEPGLIRLIDGAGVDAEKLAVGEVVTPLDYEYQGQTEPDPHVWGDVENAIAMVAAIRDALIALDPDSEATYSENADRLTAALTELDGWIIAQTETIPAERRKLVTTHDAFQYYASAYDLDIIGTLIGISTEEQPSAQTVQRLVEAVKVAQIPAIFAETTINPQLIRTVAEEANVELAPAQLYSDSIGPAGSAGDSYLRMMAANTQTIVQALGGEVTPFE